MSDHDFDVDDEYRRKRFEEFDPVEHQRERNARLERENDMLRDERKRLERLLAHVLNVAVGGTNVDPLVLLDVIAEADGIDLVRPAWLAEREQRDYHLEVERTYGKRQEVTA